MPKPAFAALLVAVAAVVVAPAPPEQDWPFYGGDPGGSRYSSALQITRENVAQLKVAWTLNRISKNMREMSAHGTYYGNLE